MALSDRREVSAVQLRDAETDEIVFEATTSGRKAPSTFPWNECGALEEKDVAARIISLGRQYSLTMPASDEATAALEHLLILVEDRPLRKPAPQPAPGVRDRSPSVEETAHQSAGLARGDILPCLFPTRRSGPGNPVPRPCLVVDTRQLGGKTYLDIAWGGPLDPSGPAPHELALLRPAEMMEAQIDIPTRFNLRRRVLVPEGASTFLRGRLGRIGKRAWARLGESLIHAGDASPAPIEEAGSPARPPTVERRRSKSVRPGMGR